jgi:hypothetical protein
MNTNELIAELGIETLTPEQQQRVLDELNMRVGEAMLEGLSSEQIGEYEAIINGDEAIISAWLDAHDPEYADTIAYQQLSEGDGDDAEKVPANKVYASMAWVEKNHPNLNETVASIKATMKTNLEQYKQ